MSAFVDLTGLVFERLRVIGRHKTEKKGAWWDCVCECGNSIVVCSADLNRGHTTSCGCLRNERLLASITKHGGRHSVLWHRWEDMKQRCFNPNNTRYKDWGGRGITVCNEWSNDFTAFRDWALSHGYSEDLTIDRIDNDGNYEPGNCRFVTMREQNMNKRDSAKYQRKGQEDL